MPHFDVAGRDQQDMKIHLVRDSERLVWNFAKSETEMWKEPPEPLLEKIADTLFSESDRWEGTASELCERLCGGYKAECTFFKAQYQRKQAVS